MARYFMEVGYRGTGYSGFQVQENAHTVQAEIETALALIQRREVVLTGSSRTDTGVHAVQNYFHFDLDEALHPQATYKLNAILPRDIVIRSIGEVGRERHCRFDALSRSYTYRLHRKKDPFLEGLSLYFPYSLDEENMHKASKLVLGSHDFTAFSKSNSDVKNYVCNVIESSWIFEKGFAIYNIRANRFLRGMVRLITGSMLRVGRGKITVNDFQDMFEKRKRLGFSAPPQGLFLEKVEFPENYFSATGLGLVDDNKSFK